MRLVLDLAVVATVVATGGAVSGISAEAAAIATSPNADIYAVAARGGDPVDLTKDPRYETDPAPSPDGRAVAFLRSDSAGTDVWQMNVDGSHQRQLTRLGTVEPDSLAWSPDGRMLALSTVTGCASPPNFYCWISTVHVIDADGTDLHAVATRADAPTWSPSSRQLAVLTLDPLGEGDGVAIVGADGSGVSRAIETGPASEPVWAPRGAALAYVSRLQRWGIFVVDTRNGRRRFVRRGRSMRWSPDGKTIAFVRDHRDGRSIYSIDLATRRTKRLTNPNLVFDAWSPVWSPGQRRLAFVGTADGRWLGLYVMLANGKTLRRLDDVVIQSDADRPAWAPDGRRIFYTGYGSANDTR